SPPEAAATASEAPTQLEEAPGVRTVNQGASLRDEIRAAAKEREAEQKKLARDRAALAAERKRLEKLATDVEAARASLREETARLDERLAAPPPPPEKKAAAPAAPIPDERIDGVARAVRGMRPENA